MKKISIRVLAFLIALISGLLAFSFLSIAEEITPIKYDTLYFTDSSGNVVFDDCENKYLYPNVLITNNSDIPITGKILISLYSDNNTILSMNIVDVNQNRGRKLYTGNGFDFPTGAYVKAYLWDSFNNIRPLSKDISNDGVVINLPESFPEIPFIIKRNGVRDYSHNATVYNMYDWTNATEVFISCTGPTSGSFDGTNPAQPISITLFKSKYLANAYNGQKNFIFTVVDDFFSDTVAFPISDYGINALVRSGAPSKFTWIGKLKMQNVNTEISSNWTAYEGIFKTTQVGAEEVICPVNFANTDTYGMPKPYVKALSLDACKATKGTFYQEGTSADVFCNPFDGESIADVSLLMNKQLVNGRNIAGNTLAFENLGFLAESYGRNFHSTIRSSNFMFFGCKFYRGKQDGFCANGSYSAWLFDCVAAYPSKDGFNFSNTDATSLGVEINCTAYGSGQYKLAGGNTTTNSNNGSTSHAGMYMLRVGGRYFDCEGAIVADVNDTFSISIGCEAKNVLDTTNQSSKVTFMMSNYGDLTPSTINKKYIVDCFGASNNLYYNMYGENGTYYVDFEGGGPIYKDSKTIVWAKILSGEWQLD